MASSINDAAAVGKLLETHRDSLLAMIRRRLPPALAARVDAEEILSEAFLIARRKYDDFKAQNGLSAYPWLYRIVLDCILMAWRHANRDCRDIGRELPWPEQSAVQLGVGLIDTGTSPSAAATRQELRDRVRRAVEQLGAADQEILWMRHEDQLSFKEAGMVLGISESGATLRYVRALRRLKALWNDLAGPGESRA